MIIYLIAFFIFSCASNTTSAQPRAVDIARNRELTFGEIEALSPKEINEQDVDGNTVSHYMYEKTSGKHKRGVLSLIASKAANLDIVNKVGGRVIDWMSDSEDKKETLEAIFGVAIEYGLPLLVGYLQTKSGPQTLEQIAKAEGMEQQVIKIKRAKLNTPVLAN